MWQGPTNAVYHSVNVAGVFVLLGGAWETSILHAVIKLISAVYSQQCKRCYFIVSKTIKTYKCENITTYKSGLKVSYFFLLFGVSPTFSYFRVKFLLFPTFLGFCLN